MRLRLAAILALRRVATIKSIGLSTCIEGSKLSDREVERLLLNLAIKKCLWCKALAHRPELRLTLKMQPLNGHMFFCFFFLCGRGVLMTVFFAIVSAVVILVLLWAIMVYNGLVQLKNNVARAWANIDVILKQRHDELPKLVEVCRQYKQFEQETLERVIAARAQVASARESRDVQALGIAEGELHAGLGRIFAVAEAYPELRSNEQFMQLQARITALENTLADRREFYNESVNLINVRIEQFPDSLIARNSGFRVQALLEFSADEKTDVDLRALFDA
jgi:LemA protein